MSSVIQLLTIFLIGCAQQTFANTDSVQLDGDGSPFALMEGDTIIEKILAASKERSSLSRDSFLHLGRFMTNFTAKVWFLTVNGTLYGGNGTMYGLPNIYRKEGTTRLAMYDDSHVSIIAELAIRGLIVTFDYGVNVLTISKFGHAKANVANHTFLLNVSLELLPKCYANLQSFHVSDFKNTQLEVSGFSFYDMIVSYFSSKFANEIINGFKKQIQKSLTIHFARAVEDADICNKFTIEFEAVRPNGIFKEVNIPTEVIEKGGTKLSQSKLQTRY